MILSFLLEINKSLTNSRQQMSCEILTGIFYFEESHCSKITWDKVFKNSSSKICGRQTLKWKSKKFEVIWSAWAENFLKAVLKTLHVRNLALKLSSYASKNIFTFLFTPEGVPEKSKKQCRINSFLSWMYFLIKQKKSFILDLSKLKFQSFYKRHSTGLRLY